eukprot:1536479-Pleurochrysis_carterae.AAC.10
MPCSESPVGKDMRRRGGHVANALRDGELYATLLRCQSRAVRVVACTGTQKDSAPSLNITNGWWLAGCAATPCMQGDAEDEEFSPRCQLWAGCVVDCTARQKDSVPSLSTGCCWMAGQAATPWMQGEARLSLPARTLSLGFPVEELGRLDSFTATDS